MKRIKALDSYQKIILMLMLGMCLVFSGLYIKAVNTLGVQYHEEILTPKEVDGTIIYSGKEDGEKVTYTVVPEKSVEFSYGDKTYGPYTVKIDKTAIPYEVRQELADNETIKGVELYCKEELVFRGAVVDNGNMVWIYDEKGDYLGDSYNGDAIDEEFFDESVEEIDLENVDFKEPSKARLLDLLFEPALSHKGDLSDWFFGIFICILSAGSILFADELFRWNLSFLINNPEKAEASDWEITTRYVAWTFEVIFALMIFIMGLY